jgi:glycosyltransferase involved in cell wall biosynthesis
MTATTNTVVSIFDHHAVSVAGMETYARELSVQLDRMGWRSILVFASRPSDEARRFLDLPNTELRAVEGCGRFAYRTIRDVVGLLRAYRPKIMHLHFVDAKSGYPWLAKLLGVSGIYMHDHISRLCPHCTTDCNMRAQGGGADYRTGCVLRVPRWKLAANWLACLPVTMEFCVSSFIHRCDVAYGAMPRERLELLYNGVDLARAATGATRAAEFRQRHRIPPDRVLVVQAGTMRREKGIPDLLHAAQRVLETGADVHFLLAGDGPQRDEFERLAAQLGISERVTFSGRVRDPLGDGLWAACDVACQVSRWQEAFGLTIAEAMAAGKPLIGTRTGAIPELIDDGRSGHLVEPGDTQALAERILSLAQNARQRCEMGQIGRRICHEKFDLQKNVAVLIDRYGIAGGAHRADGGK